MTVAELKEALDDYGDHLTVRLVSTAGEHDYVFDIDTVSDDNTMAEPFVSIYIGDRVAS